MLSCSGSGPEGRSPTILLVATSRTCTVSSSLAQIEKRLAVLGQHDAARALTDADRLLDLERVAVDDGDRVAFLVRDVDGIGERVAGNAD